MIYSYQQLLLCFIFFLSGHDDKDIFLVFISITIFQHPGRKENIFLQIWRKRHSFEMRSIIHVTGMIALIVIEYAYMFARGYVSVCKRAVNADSYLGKRMKRREYHEYFILVYPMCLLRWLSIILSRPFIARSKCIRLLCFELGLHGRV